MLCSDLTVTLMIMVIALALNHGLAAKEIVNRGRPTSPSRRSLAETLPERNDRFRSATARAFKKSKRIKNGYRRNWFLGPAVIRLKNIIDKYELKGEQLKALYPGVEACGLSGCRKFQGLIPENQLLKDLECLKQKRGFRKTVQNFLFYFHEGILIIEKSFHILLEFEENSSFNDDERRKILREFKTDLKSLNLELESLMGSKRLQFGTFPLPKILSPAFSSQPGSKTDLMIYEWRVIQGTKRFLKEWQVNMRNILKCWKKRKRLNQVWWRGTSYLREMRRHRQEERKYRRSVIRLP